MQSLALRAKPSLCYTSVSTCRHRFSHPVLMKRTNKLSTYRAAQGRTLQKRVFPFSLYVLSWPDALLRSTPGLCSWHSEYCRQHIVTFLSFLFRCLNNVRLIPLSTPGLDYFPTLSVCCQPAGVTEAQITDQILLPGSETGRFPRNIFLPERQ